MNAFNLHGPEFLACYLLFYLLSVAAAWAVFDHHLRSETLLGVPKLEPYEIAYLAGGAPRAFLTAIAVLAELQLIKIGSVSKTVSIDKYKTPRDLLPMEQKLYEIAEKNPTMKEAFDSFEIALRPTKQRLTSMTLLATDAQYHGGRTTAFWVMISLPALVGLPQLINGIASHRPVGLLVFLMIMTFFITCIFFATQLKSRLTANGKEVLDALHNANSALKWTYSSRPSAVTKTEAAIACGLFGSAAIAGGTAFLAAKGAMKPSAAGASGCGGGGCGFSGCGSSGGSGCGGGGCGGGGCGGCGGGCGG